MANAHKGSTRVIACSCKHDWQDRQYGTARRVHNYSRNANSKAGGWRCTVCGNVKGANTGGEGK